MALIFPVLLLGALWYFELDGIWFNFVGVNILGAMLGIILLLFVLKEIKRRESELPKAPELYIATEPDTVSEPEAKQ